jgi:shikimate 5-dehydrogenase
MQNAAVRNTSSALKIAVLAGSGGIAAAVVMALAATAVAPTAVEARPAFAQQTGFACTKCHTAPPALTSYGKSFKAAGNQVPTKKK